MMNSEENCLWSSAREPGSRVGQRGLSSLFLLLLLLDQSRKRQAIGHTAREHQEPSLNSGFLPSFFLFLPLPSPLSPLEGILVISFVWVFVWMYVCAPHWMQCQKRAEEYVRFPGCWLRAFMCVLGIGAMEEQPEHFNEFLSEETNMEWFNDHVLNDSHFTGRIST